MYFSKLRRKFEETLSEGRGMQLIWLLAIIICILLIFWAIIAFVFKDGSLEWQDLLALFLDPGCFGGAGKHDAFRLIATLCGMFLFSALLISVVSNMFENIAESFKNGSSRFSHEDHVLILGGGNHLFSMLAALVADDSPYQDNQIVVMTSQDVEALRAKVFSIFDGEDRRRLRKRLTLYHGDRDNENDLGDNQLAAGAVVIYIIGEDGEVDHDSTNIRCCRKLKALCPGSSLKPCYLVLSDTASIDAYKYVKNSEKSEGSCLRVDVIDANEYVAEQVLVMDHDGKNKVSYPIIDYREIIKDEAGVFQLVPGILEDTPQHVHLAIAGMTAMARAMALTAAQICHFPNFKDGRNRTVITFIDSGMSLKMDRFISSLPELFRLSHYRYVTFDKAGNPEITDFEPDREYGDFLDIEWEFIDSEICSPGMRNMLRNWAGDSQQSLSLALCLSSQKDNTEAALHLPMEIHLKGCPIFVHQQGYDDVLAQAGKTGHFGNMHTFGMSFTLQDDPLYVYRSRLGQRVNFVYNQAYAKGKDKYDSEIKAWYSIPEAHKLSSIHCANAMYIRTRSFSLADADASVLDRSQQACLYDVEHRRWVMSELMLGYAPLTEERRNEWKSRRLGVDKEIATAANLEYKALKARFIHMDITPYDDLIPSEKEKDKVIIDQMPYVLGYTDSMKKPE